MLRGFGSPTAPFATPMVFVLFNTHLRVGAHITGPSVRRGGHALAILRPKGREPEGRIPMGELQDSIRHGLTRGDAVRGA